MKKAFLSLLAFAFFTGIASLRHSSDAWNPDAGLIPSYTLTAFANASSNPKAAALVLDDDPGTAWQSEAPLPEAFIPRADLNVWLRQKNFPAKAVDGDLSSVVTLSTGTASFALEKEGSIQFISLKAQVNAPLKVQLTCAGKTETVGSYLPADNFTLKRFEVNFPKKASHVVLAGGGAIELFELAALAGLPTESVVVDLGKAKPVGTIYTRHFAGENAATAAAIYLSEDRQHWTKAGDLLPSAVHTYINNVSPEQSARFIKVEYTLAARDWNKVFCWEIKAYDRHGHYGKRPEAQPGHTKIREMLGVNGYWSWGTDMYSDEHPAHHPPKLLRSVASHARNYHDLTWDLKRPSDPIDFQKMANGGGTPALEWLNWDREYAAWNAAGLQIQASIQIYKFAPSDWRNPQQEAHDYGLAFARHFGSTKGNGYVCTLEAGNEPWKYDAPTYRSILLGMATGAKKGDPALEVFPCALQAADPSTEQSDAFKNYIGARISPEAAALLDGINAHCYSYVNDPGGKRRAVHPEHPNSTFWEILNAIRWRNANMPGKKIYLSEWGWDSDGAGETCTHDECVTEAAAAAYAVRGALIAARLGIERATWFFYANEKLPSSLYTRSGLTGSVSTGFRKKMTFTALESLVKTLGETYFLEVVREDETAWMYLFGDASGRATHLVAWCPVEKAGGESIEVSWKTSKTVTKAVYLDGQGAQGSTVVLEKPRNGSLRLVLKAEPLVLTLSH